jgi:hypothetical protein
MRLTLRHKDLQLSPCNFLLLCQLEFGLQLSFPHSQLLYHGVQFVHVQLINRFLHRVSIKYWLASGQGNITGGLWIQSSNLASTASSRHLHQLSILIQHTLTVCKQSDYKTLLMVAEKSRTQIICRKWKKKLKWSHWAAEANTTPNYEIPP